MSLLGCKCDVVFVVVFCFFGWRLGFKHHYPDQLKTKRLAGQWWGTQNSRGRGQRISELEASLVYRVSGQRNPVSKKTTNKEMGTQK